MKDFSNRIKKSFAELTSSSSTRRENLSEGLLNQSQSIKSSNSNERSSLDAFEDLEFRERLQREERQVYKEIEAKKIIEKHDRELAMSMAYGEEVVQNQEEEEGKLFALGELSRPLQGIHFALVVLLIK